jgi:antitoxin component YwqK of YwqJK toxin-antitoxin module
MIKLYLIASFLWFSLAISGQLPIDTTDQTMISMGDTYQSSKSGKSKYYQEGHSQAYSGVLFGRYSNGNFASIQEYVDGRGQGKWVNFFEDGTISEIGNYEDNLVTGPITKYYDNGNIKAAGQYRNWRVKVGIWKYYNAMGELTDTIDYGTKGSKEEIEEWMVQGKITRSFYQWAMDTYNKG